METYSKKVRLFESTTNPTEIDFLTVPVVQYLDYWENVFDLNETFTAGIHEKADRCGYTEYINKYLTFPPPTGPFPKAQNSSEGCDVFTDVFNAALAINPCRYLLKRVANYRLTPDQRFQHLSYPRHLPSPLQRSWHSQHRRLLSPRSPSLLQPQ